MARSTVFPSVFQASSGPAACWTAPNLGTDVWHAYPLANDLAQRLGKPTRVLNDASVQGLGEISGEGLECVITLGTGFGFALFQDGRLAPHLELGQHPCAKDKTYDLYLGNAAFHKVGRKKWNKRLERALGFIDTLVTYDTLLIGGGNAQVIDFDLPANVRIVPNAAGIIGGVKLWGEKMNPVFDPPHRPPPRTPVRNRARAGSAVAAPCPWPPGLRPGRPPMDPDA